MLLRSVVECAWRRHATGTARVFGRRINGNMVAGVAGLGALFLSARGLAGGIAPSALLLGFLIVTIVILRHT